MPGTSTVKNVVQTIVKKDKWLNAAFAGAKHVVFSFGRVFYAFWLQTTGLVFVLLTLAGIKALSWEYYKFHFADHKRVAVECLFTVACLVFTIQSFGKAKRTLKKR
jgi:hypothetical protein